MTGRKLVCMLVLAAAFCWGARASWAQQGTGSAAHGDVQDKPATAYRLDFTLTEMEDGKRTNSRQYSLNLVPGYTTSNELKIGTRVPVEIKQGELQYIDVGTSLWSRMAEREGAAQLEVRAEISGFADAGQEKAANPMLRQLRINSSTVATLGKPMVVGVVDDPNSKRQFQLEVMVTKLK